MKKIVSLAAAAAFALGLAGCTGDLHDQAGIDMGQLSVTGDFNGWATPGISLNDNGDGSYRAEFTAASASTVFCIITGSGWSGSAGDYRGTAAGALAQIEVGTPIDLYPFNSPDCAPVSGVKVGTSYIVTVTPQTGYLNVLIEEGVTPPDLFIVSGASIDKMELAGDGIYTSKVTAAGTSYDFKVFDGARTFGAKAASISLNAKTDLISTEDAKTISVTGLKADNDYVITVDYSDVDAVTVLVEADAFKAFIIGDISGEFVRMTNLTDTIVSYTFEYADSMTAWDGGSGTINFVVNDKDSWSGNTKIFRNKELVLNSAYEDSGEADENAKVSGLVAGNTYTILVDVSGNDDLKKAKIIDGKPLFIAGAMNSWSFEMLENDAEGAYFLFASDAAGQDFKINFVPAWTDGETAFAGATVSGATKVKSGNVGPGADNASVTASAGNKLYVSYDKTEGAYVAWVSSN